jgi:hypothetical protein
VTPRADGAALLVAAMLVLAAVAVLELSGVVDSGGALLPTLALWTAIAQGCVAVAAAGEVTGARWIAAVRAELFAAGRLLPLLAALFALAAFRLDRYGWSASPGGWLNPPFFVGRGLFVLALAALLARALAARALRRDAAARPLAIAYLLAFAASQTLVAFDWIMSLSYPWVSSMLGMYFTVEALYAGLATAGLLFLLGRRGVGARHPSWVAASRDAGLLVFGFSVLWGGLFFAQFLLLWYGNLPEEVSFIATRISAWPTRALAPAFIAACWATPFFLLLPARTKRSVPAVAAVALVILAGLLAERLFLSIPALRPGPWILAAENVLLLLAWGIVVRDARQAGAQAQGGGA